MDTYRRSGIVTGILFLVADAAGFLALFAQRVINAPSASASQQGKTS
jgi:hypothetical protein